jgi:hypothetical protein
MNRGCEAERQQPVRDGAAAGKLLLCTLLVDMNPLLVAGRLRETVDTVLGDLNPVVDTDLGARGRFDFVEAIEYPHIRLPGF